MNKQKISIFDVDDTLLRSGAKIGYIIPDNDGNYSLHDEKLVTTNQFAEVRGSLPKNTIFDFLDFRSEFDAGDYYPQMNLELSEKEIRDISRHAKIDYKYSIVDAIPLETLKKVQDAADRGDKIGILTARGAESKDTFEALNLFFKENDININRGAFQKKFVIGVSNPRFVNHCKTGGDLLSTEDLKRHALNDIFMGKFGFKEVDFYDDDLKNVEIADSIDGVNAIHVEG